MTGLPPTLDRVIGLSGGMLDMLLPMHLWIGADGRIVQAGPTLAKMSGRVDLVGRDVFEVIALRRPTGVEGLDDLEQLAGRRLSIALTSAPDLGLRGTLAPLPGGRG
ncbi:hypothetical protein HKCCSP123_18430 [Rhodobacterales bacterium HKCCSP123]|nr:hypothetical protein [Rhodobacterales bacterium HKCCSP123]